MGFVAPNAGSYQVTVKMNGEHISGSRFKLKHDEAAYIRYIIANARGLRSRGVMKVGFGVWTKFAHIRARVIAKLAMLMGTAGGQNAKWLLKAFNTWKPAIAAEVEYVPSTATELPDEQADAVLELVAKIEGDEDVQRVFHNLA